MRVAACILLAALDRMINSLALRSRPASIQNIFCRFSPSRALQHRTTHWIFRAARCISFLCSFFKTLANVDRPTWPRKTACSRSAPALLSTSSLLSLILLLARCILQVPTSRSAARSRSFFQYLAMGRWRAKGLEKLQACRTRAEQHLLLPITSIACSLNSERARHERAADWIITAAMALSRQKTRRITFLLACQERTQH
mmetsp:Transcript_18960/g.62346  ORF Transcript_18960/g.62346 Transcript_18960/m.62346 type:complete len:200 (-) Transcript_18960:2226-2825(-)